MLLQYIDVLKIIKKYNKMNLLNKNGKNFNKVISKLLNRNVVKKIIYKMINVNNLFNNV